MKLDNAPVVPRILAVLQVFSTQDIFYETQRHVGNPVLLISQLSYDFLAAQIKGKS